MDDAPTVDGSPPVEEPSDGADWDTDARVDALAARIDMLGEELDGRNQAFNQRVAQRTAELDESVRQLQRSNQQVSELTEMSNLLQAAVDREEAFNVLGRFAPEIFAGASGGIYTYPYSREHLEAATMWGPHQG